jgi:hypothetical protein
MFGRFRSITSEDRVLCVVLVCIEGTIQSPEKLQQQARKLGYNRRILRCVFPLQIALC